MDRNGGLRRVILFTSILILLRKTSAQSNDDCKIVSTDEVSMVFLSEITSSSTCDSSKFSTATLAINLIAEYAIHQINEANDSTLRPPGIQYNLEFIDICSNGSYAVKSVATRLPNSMWTDQKFCAQAGNKTESLTMGFLGPTLSSNAVEVAAYAGLLNMSVVSPSATLPALSDRIKYPSFFRKAATDLDQSKALVDLLLKLNIRYAMLVHSNDVYGKTGAQEIRNYAMVNGVCINQTIMVIDDQLQELASNLYEDEANAVVYFGGEEARDVMSQYLRLVQDRGAPVRKKAFLFSDGVNIPNIKLLIKSFNPNNPQQGQLGGIVDIFFIQPYSTPSLINSIKTYIRGRINESIPGSSQTKKWLEENQDQTLADTFGFAQSTMGSVLSLARAFTTTHSSICQSDSTVCTDLHSKTDIFYGRMFLALKENKDNVTFDGEMFNVGYTDFGEDYQINSRIYSYSKLNATSKEAVIENIGYYVKDIHNNTTVQLSTNISSVNSSCRRNCCSPPPQVYFYKEGASPLLIIGMGTMSDSKGKFECGDLRSSQFLRMEAFYYSIQILETQFGIGYSTLYIDTCAAKLRVNKIFTNLFTNDHQIRFQDVYGRDIIKSIDKIVAVVGDQSSGTTIQAQQIIGDFSIPHISDGATSVWLSDANQYPYFLRTVPADNAQANAIIQLIQRLGVAQIGLVSTESIYGKTGAELVKSSAASNGICISHEVTLGTGTNSLDSIADELAETEGSQVYVYFGEKENIENLLARLGLRQSWRINKKIFIGSELWSNDVSILEQNEEVLLGSLTLGLNNANFMLTDSEGKNQFQEFLKTVRPANMGGNRLFMEFWQEHFKCHIRGELGSYGTECSDSCSLGIQGSCNADMLDYSETYAVRTIMTVLSIGYAFKGITNCQQLEPELCLTNLLREDRRSLFNLLKDAKIPAGPSENFPTITLFNENGSGSPDYVVYNIQERENEHRYVPVYTILNGSLAEREQPRFYTDGNKFQAQFPINQCVGSQCTCEATSSAQMLETTTQEAIPSTTINIIILVLCIVVITILVVLVFLIIIYFKVLKKDLNNSKKGNDLPMSNTESAPGARYRHSPLYNESVLYEDPAPPVLPSISRIPSSSQRSHQPTTNSRRNIFQQASAGSSGAGPGAGAQMAEAKRMDSIESTTDHYITPNSIDSRYIGPSGAGNRAGAQMAEAKQMHSIESTTDQYITPNSIDSRYIDRGPPARLSEDEFSAPIENHVSYHSALPTEDTSLVETVTSA